MSRWCTNERASGRTTAPAAGQASEQPAAESRLHLVVLYGGQSAEHEVSCVTATHVLRAVDTARYRVTPIGISTEGEWALADAAQRALEAGPDALPARLDPSGTAISPVSALAADPGERTVVLPLLHGPMGEDGTVQGLLELADVAYVGAGVLGSALAMDKAMAKQVLAANGIAQARYRAFADHQRTPGLPARVGRRARAPLLRQAVQHGFVHRRVEGQDGRATPRRHRPRLDLRRVGPGRGGRRRSRDRGRCPRRPRPPKRRAPGRSCPSAEFYDYEDKYVTDGAQLLIPAPLTPAQTDEVRALAVRVFQLLRADGLARVDFFLEEGGRGFLCNEANTMPGFTPISMYPKLWQAAGVSYAELIDRLVAVALERHERRRRNTKH